jgi:hypothetical protein
VSSAALGLDESQARNRDGWGLASGVEHRLPLAPLETELIGGVSYLYYSARGSEYSYGGVGSWVGTDTELPFDAAFRTAIGYAYLGYRHPRPIRTRNDVPNPLPATGTVYPPRTSDATTTAGTSRSS